MIAAGEQHLMWWREADEAGEPDLAALITQFSGLIYRVAFSVVRHAAEAEDVVQETFVRVLEHRAKLPQLENLRAWLVRIALNLALDRVRRMRPVPMDEVIAETAASPAPGVATQVMSAVELARVLNAMERLPKAERMVLVLTAFEQLSAAEIAGIVGRSQSSVRALLFRARERLKQRLSMQETGKGGA
ncbi:MAG TPA: sigma-70 family RNA polymerase sigma factor [Acidobacteriaceae bacterium]